MTTKHHNNIETINELLSALPPRSFPVHYEDCTTATELEDANRRALVEAKAFVKSWPTDHGYSLSISHSGHRSSVGPSSIRKFVYMICSRGGHHRRRNGESASYRSHKTNCKFRIQLVLREESWHVIPDEEPHNHDATPRNRHGTQEAPVRRSRTGSTAVNGGSFINFRF